MTTDTLTADLRRLLTSVTDDLRGRSDRDDLAWAVALRDEYDDARRAGRTAFTWSQWRDGEIDQAAVAWILGTVFVRFCEDNDLVAQRWIAGPGDGLRLAVDAESAFYAANPRAGTSDWLHTAFGALADLDATGGILDRDHSLVWRITPGDDVCRDLLTYWRATGDGGTLAHPLTSPDLDTRFLGDLYQDLSELAKKKYALLQTPDFVEEFILDRTLDPAIAEFGLPGLRLIDPTCGSGHFLLGAFGRLLAAWQEREPAAPAGENIRRALDSVYGVDLNPFAAAIARFRLAVAALRASGFRRLKDAPNWTIHVAVGDSLLGGMSQGALIDDQGAAGFHYRNEDITEYPRILESGRYHVVVGNPPYITVEDPALNHAYRDAFRTCHREYALSVPFMELFFRLAIRGSADRGAGYVGQITSNSFMKREFGSKVIETLLSGAGGPSHIDQNPVDLLDVIDTSGAYIPGHGTPTVILIGRRRPPIAQTVHAVLGVRGEPGAPVDPRKGLVWSQIVGHIDDSGGFDGEYVTVTDLPRVTFATHPWSLSGGASSATKALIDTGGSPLNDVTQVIGYTGQTNADDVFLAPARAFGTMHVEASTHRQVVIGEVVRDFTIGESNHALFVYGPDELLEITDFPGAYRRTWPYRTVTWNRRTFAKTSYLEEGRTWWEWHQVALDRLRTPLSIAFAFVATHNHFVLDRGGKVFKQSAPVIKLPADATEDDHLGLLGVLNSSVACFWLKQVSHNKGRPGAESGGADEPWEHRFEFTGTKLQEFPLPTSLPAGYGFVLDALAQQSSANIPSAVLSDDSVLPSRAVLEAARDRWEALRAQMIAWQEELDWHTYATYGLIDESLTYLPQPDPPAESSADASTSTTTFPAAPATPSPTPSPTMPPLPPAEPGERAFAIVLARRMRDQVESSTWFVHHNHKFTPIADVPAEWPHAYRELVALRIAAIEANPQIRLLERPEFKRRWAHESWESMQTAALRGYILDRLEDQALWSDAQGPRVLSVAALAEAVRHDEAVQAGIEVLFGADADRVRVLGALVADEAVPFLAALRYTDAGMRKRAEWEAVWELQRREDAGEVVDIPVPPKYTNKDFRKVSYWSARGKLDVPKERFISYSGGELGADSTLVVGWAGWDHAEQARALARLLVTGVSRDGWEAERVTPLLAGLVELEPWLRQWHADPVPGFPTSPAQAIKGLVDQRLAAAGLTRSDVAAWRPPTPVRGRRKG
jgi:hypothetical protein